jgi:predicted nucleic acid-binding protein
VSATPIPLCVVDSSVVYEWFNSDAETSVAQARALIEEHQLGTRLLAAPAHMPAEVMNALRYAGLGEADLRLAAEALDAAEIMIAPLDGELLAAAVSVAAQYDLTIHDALFAALAIQAGCDLVTADRKQARVRECPVRLQV